MNTQPPPRSGASGRRRKRLLGLAVVLVASTGLLLCLVRTPEPSYQGRSASAWLDTLDKPGSDRETVFVAFRAMGPEGARFLARELDRKPSWLREQLWGLKFSGRLPPWLANRVPDWHDHRRDTAEFLRALGRDAEPALPTLLRIFREGDPNELVQSSVNATLMAMGDRLEFMVPELTQNLSDSHGHIRVLCADLLGSIGRKAKPAVPALETMARAGGWSGRSAALALIKIAGQTNLAIEVLTRALDPTAPIELRQFVLLDLGDLGPAARPAVPRIQRALGDTNAEVREQAAKALGAIDPTALEHSVSQVNRDLVNQADRLIEQVRTGRFADEAKAIDALAVIGPDARKAVPILMEILDQSRISNFPVPVPDPLREQMALLGLKSAAARALGRIGPDARVATSRLVQQLRAHDGSLTTECTLESCRALREIGPFAVEAVPVLHTLLEDRNENVRIAVARALLRIAPENASTAHATLKQIEKDAGPWIDLLMSEAFTQMQVVVGLWEADQSRPCPAPKLIEVLRHKEVHAVQDEILKGCAAQLLGEIGPEAEDAIPALLDFMKVGTTHSQRTAALAIRKIDPEAAARLGLPGLLALP